MECPASSTNPKKRTCASSKSLGTSLRGGHHRLGHDRPDSPPRRCHRPQGRQLPHQTHRDRHTALRRSRSSGRLNPVNLLTFQPEQAAQDSTGADTGHPVGLDRMDSAVRRGARDMGGGRRRRGAAVWRRFRPAPTPLVAVVTAQLEANRRYRYRGRSRKRLACRTFCHGRALASARSISASMTSH